MTETYSDDFLRRILEQTRTIVMVGASTNPVRASYFVASYMHARGRRVIPVNPMLAGQTLLGETILARIADIPPGTGVQMLDIFRRSEEVPAIFEEAMEHLVPGLKSIWMQFGVRHEGVAERARAAGIDVVMDRCVKVEHARLTREIGAVGIPSRIISSRLPPKI